MGARRAIVNIARVGALRCLHLSGEILLTAIREISVQARYRL